MAKRVVIFDNGYRYFIDKSILTDENNDTIADFCDLIRETSIVPQNLSNEEIWWMCKPAIMAYEIGIKRAKKEVAHNIIKIFKIEEVIK